ncbi:MAG: SusD/RagB family nutrient-binding outer membrane lipoprotein [Agriterribacter sp.]
MKFKYISAALLVLLTASCKKADFVEKNTDPNVLYGVKPEEQFFNAPVRAHNSDFEAYYDYYRRIMPWMQMNTGNTGNSKNFLTEVGNFNQRYGVFFPQLGGILTDVQYIIDNMPEEEQAARVHMRAIPDVLKVYYAFYVSDIVGSIPYADAFQGRYGGELNPAYQSQQELYDLWDAKLKEVIGILTTTPSAAQTTLGNFDLYFNGDALKWAKAANALRLRMALRLLKRDQAKAVAIIQDALSNNAVQMVGEEDSWIFKGAAAFTSGGNWNPTEFRAPKPTVDFMWENSDPRIRFFYKKNNYTQANMNVAIDSGLYAPGTIANPRQYVGAPTSPDVSQSQPVRSWFDGKEVNGSLTLDTISYLQWRLWQPAYDNGDGVVTIPVINYADYCFMRAEIYQRDLVSGDAEEWYNKGVEASLRFFDQAAKIAELEDYSALTAQEVTNYLNADDVRYDEAKGLEQIIVQAYINFHKQPNEAWANYKRTGMPNKNTVLANSDIVIDGTVKEIPRRAALSVPAPTDQNYSTKKPAIDAMDADPEFGQGPSDMFGRIWWDKQ